MSKTKFLAPDLQALAAFAKRRRESLIWSVVSVKSFLVLSHHAECSQPPPPPTLRTWKWFVFIPATWRILQFQLLVTEALVQGIQATFVAQDQQHEQKETTRPRWLRQDQWPFSACKRLRSVLGNCKQVTSHAWSHGATHTHSIYLYFHIYIYTYTPSWIPHMYSTLSLKLYLYALLYILDIYIYTYIFINVFI